MSAPTNHWKLGLFVVVGTVMTLAAAAFFGTRNLRKETVSYHSYFDESVTGLEAGSPVKFRGVTIGNVSAIDVAPDRRHVAITYELGVSVLGQLGLAKGGQGQHTKLAVPPDLRAQLGSMGVTGVKYILIDFFDIKGNPAPKLSFPVSGNYIPAASSMMKNIEDSLVHAVDEFPKLANEMGQVLERVNHMMAEVDESKLPDKVVALLARVDKTVELAQTKLGKVKAEELSNEAQAAMVNLNLTMTKMQTIMERVDGDRGVLASVQRASDSFGDVAGTARGFGPELGETMRDMREAANAIRQLADALELDSDMLVKGRSVSK